MVTCWERAGLLALVCGDLLRRCRFPIGILGQVWCLIVSIPDLCPLSYFNDLQFGIATVQNGPLVKGLTLDKYKHRIRYVRSCSWRHYLRRLVNAIILKRKRKPVALLLLSYRYVVTINVLWLFLTVPWVGLQYVRVVFPDHTHLLFLVNTKIKKFK